MGNFKYITNRPLKDKSGAEKGRIQVLVRANSDRAEGKYTCPECLNQANIDQEWLKPFILVCGKCNAKLKIPKLKDEAKKEKNAEKKILEAEAERKAKEAAAREGLV